MIFWVRVVLKDTNRKGVKMKKFHTSTSTLLRLTCSTLLQFYKMLDSDVYGIAFLGNILVISRSLSTLNRAINLQGKSQIHSPFQVL